MDPLKMPVSSLETCGRGGIPIAYVIPSMWALVKVKLALILSFLVGGVLGCVPSFATTVTIRAGAVRGGGFGDIASNLWMARLLKAERPEWNLQVAVSLEESGRIRMLVPVYDPALAVQEIDGVRFVNRSEKLLPSDSVVGFSYELQELPNLPLSREGVELTFSEFSSQFFPKLGVFRRPLQKSRLHFATGVSHLGLYVSPKAPPSPISRVELGRRIEEELEGQAAIPDLDSPNVQLAFAYSFDSSTMGRYLKALREAATSKRLSNKRIILVARHFDDLNYRDLPPNVEVVSYRRLSLDLSRNLIAHTDLPPLVTGDVSLAIALDYGKPILYENRSWKIDHTEDFMKYLSHLGASQNEIDELIFSGEESEFNAVRRMTVRLSEDPLQGWLPRNAARLREDISVVPRVINLVEGLKHWEIDGLAQLFHANSLRLLSEEITRFGDSKSVLNSLKRQFDDAIRTQDSSLILSLTGALLASKNLDYETRAGLMPVFDEANGVSHSDLGNFLRALRPLPNAHFLIREALESDLKTARRAKAIVSFLPLSWRMRLKAVSLIKKGRNKSRELGNCVLSSLSRKN